MIYGVFESPLGQLTLATNGRCLTALHIEGDRYFRSVPKEWQHQQDHPLLRQASEELNAYFAGQRTSFDVPLHFEGTDFQQAVWSALLEIPYGTVTTYSSLAAKIGRPFAVRAVGTAVGHNPLCIIVPCHRVLASDGSLGGYVAGLHRKTQLLIREGITS